MTQNLHRSRLFRLLLLWALTFTVAGLRAQTTESVSHSFADESIYGSLTPQVYFADLEADDVPEKATNLGLSIQFNPDIRLDFNYDADKVTGLNRPRTIGLYNAATRELHVTGSGTASDRTQLVFSSPSGATIKSIRIDGCAGTSVSSYTTSLPSSTNSVVYVDGEEASEANSTFTNPVNRESNYFVWEGSAKEVSFENKSTSAWRILSFTVEYEPDLTKASVPIITGDDAQFFTERTVTISSRDASATIYYTTDGSDPTTASARYTGPFVITETTTVKAFAVVAGLENSIVASVTFEKIRVYANIAALRTQATSAKVEYVQLTGAVVTLADGNIYLQDVSTDKFSGLRLLPSSSTVDLQAGDQVTGVLTGSWSPSRHEFSSWSLVGEEVEGSVTIAAGGVAPAAAVTAEDIASTAVSVSTGVYPDVDYLYQRVHLTLDVTSIGAALYGLSNATVVNALEDGQTGVQVVLPGSDVELTTGGRYSFTGILDEYTAFVNAVTTGFRTLYVLSATDITSAEGLPLGSLKLTSGSVRLLVGDEQTVSIASQSHTGAITYASSDEAVVTVDAEGKITAVGPGTAVVVVSLASDGVTGSAKQNLTVNVFEPTYQLANGNLSEWEHLQVTGGYSWNPLEYEGDEPLAWNGYVGTSSGDSQLEKNADGSARLTAGANEGYHYPGLLTSASGFEVPLSASFTPNLNGAFTYDTESTATEFTGLPDALEVVVKGSLAYDNARAAAVLYTPGFKTYPTEIDDDSREALGGTEGATVAVAENAAIAGSEDWQTLSIPFTYALEGTRPAYALVSVVTSAEPATGNATDYEADYLDVQSIRFVYNSELAAATYDGAEIEFDEDGTATVDAAFDADLLALSANGVAATIETSFNETTGVLTVTVSGDDISVNAANRHSYAISFQAAPAAETVVIDAVGTLALCQKDDYYDTDLGIVYTGPFTVEVAEGAQTEITLKNVSYSISLYGFTETFGIGSITFSGLTLDAEGHINDASVSVTIVDGDTELADGEWQSASYEPVSATISGTYADGEIEGTITLLVNYTEIITINITSGELPDLEYRRSVVAGNFGTITLNFTPETLTGIEQLYSIAGKKTDDEGNPLYIVLAEEETIEAGVPYIFVSNADEITATAAADSPTVSSPSNNDIDWTNLETIYLNNGLQGTFTEVSTDEIGEEDLYTEEIIPFNDVYLLADNIVVKAGEGSSVGANHAYILIDHVPEIEDEASVKGIRIYLDNTPTGLQSVKTSEGKAVIFNLAGQQLREARKGIHIVNGKKVLFK